MSRKPRWVIRHKQAPIFARKTSQRFVINPGAVWRTEALDKWAAKVNRGRFN